MCPKFRVTGSVYASKFIGVFEAKDEEDAIEQAEMSEARDVSVCHQCAGEVEDPEIGEMFAEQVDDDEECCINEN